MEYPNIEKLGPLSTLRNLHSCRDKLARKALISAGMTIPAAISIKDSLSLGLPFTIAGGLYSLAHAYMAGDVHFQEDVLEKILLRSVEKGSEVEPLHNRLT